jgi:pentose-5-phosphate-3-epimerase
VEIYASIYSSKLSIEETIPLFSNVEVESIHVDALYFNKKIIDDILKIKNKLFNKKIDLHIVNYDKISEVIDFINKEKIPKVYFQYENLKQKKDLSKIKEEINFKEVEVCIAFQVSTCVDDVKDEIKLFPSAMLMTTKPGISGLKFDEKCYSWLYEFKNKFKEKKLYLDGGVNDIVYEKLLNYNVNGVVVGSFLFKHRSIEDGIKKLKK